MAKLRITYTKSAIGYSQDQKDTLRSLGLRKLNSTAIQEDTPSIRGMLFKVRHLVRFEELGDEVAAAPAAMSRSTFVMTPAASPDEHGADDLERIEGIGPKIAGVLRDAGVTTFAQLAAMDAAGIEAILRESKLNLAVAETWPEQAALAAAGQWDEFTRLTETLKAGRRS